MAKIIPFYVPARMQGRLSRYHGQEERGKIIPFIPGPRGKYVWLPSGALWPVVHRSEPRERRATAAVAR